MKFTLSEDQDTVRRTLNEILDSKAPASSLNEVCSSSAGYDEALYKLLSSSGWFNLAHHSTMVELGTLLIELGRYCLPSPALSAVTAASTLEYFDLSGEAQFIIDEITSCGYSSTLWASDANLKVDNGVSRLFGRVSAVEWGSVCNIFVVIVENKDGTSSVWTTRDIGALTIHDQRALDNTRLSIVTLEGAELQGPVGSIGQAARREHRQLCRLLRACDLLGVAKGAFESTLQHVKSRNQFGAFLSEFQAVQHHLANVYIGILASSNLIYEALWRRREGLSWARQASMASWFTADKATNATQICNQLHGGIGFMAEYHLHHYYHRGIAQKIRMGRADAQLSDLADSVFAGGPDALRNELTRWPVKEEA